MCPLQPNPPASDRETIPYRSRRRAWPIGAILLGALFGVILLSVFTHAAHAGLSDRLAAFLTGRQSRLNVSSPAVVEKIRQLSRLETVDYSIDKIVEGDKANAYLPSFLAGDKLLLVAHGNVIAGVDLSQLKSSDVSIKGESVTVHLPQPQILTSRIDNNRTRVYSRMTGLLVTPDPDLESQVRQAAEQQFIRAAEADGVLDKARQNAQTSVTALLKAVGFQNIDVE